MSRILNDVEIFNTGETAIYVSESDHNYYWDPDYYTFSIYIREGRFTGSSEFNISSGDFDNVIEEISKIYNELNGTYTIKDVLSSADIKIFFDKNWSGLGILSGHIGCESYGKSLNELSLIFSCKIDQTALNNLIKFFKQTFERYKRFKHQ